MDILNGNCDLADLFSDAPEILRDWALGAANEQSERFGDVTSALISSGVVVDENDAIEHIAEITTAFVRGQKSRIFFRDIRGDGKNSYEPELKRRLGKFVRKVDPYTYYGWLAHQAIPDLYISDLRKWNSKLPKYADNSQLSFSLGRDLEWESGLFGKSLGEKKSNFTNPAEKKVKKKAGPRWHKPGTVFGGIEKIWEEANTVLADEDKQYYREMVARLERALKPIFGAYVVSLVGYAPAYAYAMLMSLTAWAGAALHFYNNTGRRYLVREVNVMSPGREISGGRLDAIEIRNPGYRPLNASQKKAVVKILAYPVLSAGHFFWQVSALRQTGLDVGVEDWKHVAGDGKNRGIVKFSEVEKRPATKDSDQIVRYLALGLVDLLHFHPEREKNSTWEKLIEDPPFGELEYFMPQGVITHKVLTEPARLHEKVVSIAERLDNAGERAAQREIWNFLLGYAISCLDGKGHEKLKRISPPAQKALVPDDRSSLPFFRKYRMDQSELEAKFQSVAPNSCARDYEELSGPVFLDKPALIEVSYSDAGKEVLTLHYDKLLRAVEAGDVKTKNFHGVDRNFFISCLVTEEKTPSFYLNLQKGAPWFKCFGCGVFGAIGRIPSDIEITVKETGSAPSGVWKPGDEPIISEEHHKFMALAQEILQMEFKGSVGEWYLAKERCLDVDLAFKMGAGFASNRLIHGLMDAGYSLDDLIAKGLVLISDKTTSTRGIGPILNRRGIRSEDMARVYGKKEGKEVMGYPYSMLLGRVTFPLTYEGKNANFYGRSVDKDAKIVHCKTSFSAVQGGFNMGVLKDPDAKEVSMIEAAICVISITQMRSKFSSLPPNSFAIIGTGNYKILDAVVKSGKQLASGLDFDLKNEADPNKGQAGQKKTLKLMAAIKERGLPRPRDVTAEFLAQYSWPTREKKFDWNALLQHLAK